MSPIDRFSQLIAATSLRSDLDRALGVGTA
jgi:hypothetical protein